MKAKEKTIQINEKLAELVDQDMSMLSCHDIASYCGTSKQAIQQAEWRALRKLRTALEPVFIEHFNRRPNYDARHNIHNRSSSGAIGSAINN
tara:strand:+ start:2298 stop:2573 length:276 start_codon:yes stop_codon:yes gene_type:complete